ncbi:annulin isoform X2 [Condylostylus longicornis]|uniref:annulin isoform X2 n=1 Tax=Condylostylus longicornis TaxID=2530218 RepID=UPI00244E3B1D|nr:annulin isoform X2 [Condylostylus longicornis]
MSNFIPAFFRRRSSSHNSTTNRPTYRQWPSAMYSTSEAIIDVKNVDLCLEENAKEHHTDRFDAAQSYLVVRRGQPFTLKITLNRPFDKRKDAISFIFTVFDDDKPSHGHGTLVGLVPQDHVNYLGDPYEWGAGVLSLNGDVMTVLIKPAVTCPVTQWKMDVDTKLIDGPSKSYTLTQPIYILFNAWCKDDQVYIEDYDERKEYLLSDTTLIWRGSYNRMRPSVWKLGQFEKHVLDCSLLLIADVGRVGAAYRGDPVRTTRALSAAINSPDDDGCILGSWEETFPDGIAPTKWIGSVEILQRYYKKRKPVKYGQCWVFSGVLTTVARALGIPSRIVTNYSSAHDTQASLTVDYFIDEHGKIMEELNTDSIWNYHVWNEVWMARPDLGVGNHGSYDGWQAVDATPQEQSDGMYRVGPAPVSGVKYGEILRPYDSNFLYSEVNADKVFWRYHGPYQPMKLLRIDTLAIGQLISTKKIGKWEREDITHTYKFPEKSDEERNTMLKALRQARSAFARYYLNENFYDVKFDFELRDDIKIGENFSVVLKIENKSTEKPYTAYGQLNVDTILYTGTHREEVKSLEYDIEVKPESSEYVKMQVDYFDYVPKMLPQGAFNISCLASVKDTEFEYFAQDDFRVRKPDIKITFQGKIISQEPVDVIVRLTNPLPIPIRKGLFHVEGPGIEKALLFKIAEIPVGGTGAATFKFTPPYAGRGTLVAKFDSKDLDDVDGFLAFEVEPRPGDVLTNGATFTNEIVIRTDVIE